MQVLKVTLKSVVQKYIYNKALLNASLRYSLLDTSILRTGQLICTISAICILRVIFRVCSFFIVNLGSRE